jgi:hypothetical protein
MLRSLRAIAHRYVDPVEAVWLATAHRIGLTVVRSPEVYAATDGAGTLYLGHEETLDADDCVAQMVFHELCHSLVEGARSFRAPDWGLDNETARHVARERACLRTQAALAGSHGLGLVLAPTTEHRAFYDRIRSSPLAGPEPEVRAARDALARVGTPPWGPHLERALVATAEMARAAARVLGAFAEDGDPLPDRLRSALVTQVAGAGEADPRQPPAEGSLSGDEAGQ